MTPETVRDTPGETSSVHPTVVLIGLDSTLRARFLRYLSQRQLRVETAATGTEGRQTVRRSGARVVVLLPDLPAESGWLTAAKLRLELPDTHVVVVVEESDLRGRQFAHFLGARVQLRQDESLAGLTALFTRSRSVAQN
jgi:DNA-binding response OmpR family regulator